MPDMCDGGGPEPTRVVSAAGPAVATRARRSRCRPPRPERRGRRSSSETDPGSLPPLKLAPPSLLRLLWEPPGWWARAT